MAQRVHRLHRGRQRAREVRRVPSINHRTSLGAIQGAPFPLTGDPHACLELARRIDNISGTTVRCELGLTGLVNTKTSPAQLQ